MRDDSDSIRTGKSGRTGLIFWSMGLLVMMYGLFVYVPMVIGFVSSFFLWNPFQKIFEFTGFQNYLHILKNEDFWHSLGNTVYFTAGALILTVGFGLLISAMIHSLKRGSGFYRGMFFLPVVTSMVAAALLWKFLYNTDNGMFNAVLMKLGLSKIPWLQDSTIALPAIMVVQSWKDIGYAVVLILAGINTIDPTIYESAEIDGCSKTKQFLYITMPLIRNSLTVLLITKLIDYMQVYTPIYFMTQGGPGKATQSITFYIYQEAFTYYNYGSASAISFILFAVIFVFSLLQLRISSKEKEQEL